MSLPSRSARKRRKPHPWGTGTIPEYLARQAASDAPEPTDDDSGLASDTELRSSPEYRALKAEVDRRSGGRCEIRGPRCTGRADHHHHRIPTQGPCGGPVIVPAWWLVHTCGQCHADCHTAATREAMERLGWIVPRSRSIG